MRPLAVEPWNPSRKTPWEQDQPGNHFKSLPLNCRGDVAIPRGLEVRSSNQRGLFSSLKSSCCCLDRFWTQWDLLLFSFLSFLFGMRMFILCHPTIVFWKHRAYIVSQRNKSLLFTSFPVYVLLLLLKQLKQTKIVILIYMSLIFHFTLWLTSPENGIN